MENFMQESFNLPHDVVKLPSKGIFYTPKKESLKVGYLTASDENVLYGNLNEGENFVTTLLRNKIYEPGFDINKMLDCDAQAVLMFLRNSSFGSNYDYTLTDPQTNKSFEISVDLSELNFLQTKHSPDENGFFEYNLPKSKVNVKCKLLNIGENTELDKLKNSYPKGMVVPTITKKLEKQIVSVNGETDRAKIASFIQNMPISDSKDLRKFLKECEPGLDLRRTVIAPSGEEVTFDVTFGVDFFRPFF